MHIIYICLQKQLEDDYNKKTLMIQIMDFRSLKFKKSSENLNAP
jgi:hypothetical protein